MDHYGVMGNPIQHSQSPRIHQLFAEQTKQQITYTPILVELDGLESALSLFQSQHGKGVNVTLPFKHRAFALMDSTSERAQHAQAINTIVFNDDGSRFGDNTDGIGLIRDLHHHITLKGKRILMVGAGGAVRGVLQPLLSEQPIEIIITNRTESKAFAFANEFASFGSIQACSWIDLNAESFDIVINGTSASLQGDALNLPASILRKDTFCYDMVYGKDITPFLYWAKQQGIEKMANGLGMLVEQAAESFWIWRGIRPNTQIILNQLQANRLL